MTPSKLIIPLILVAVVLAALKYLLPLLKKPTALPYESNGKLLSPAELSFLGVLKLALGDGYHIMAKVRLADVVSVKKGLSGTERQQAFNRIQSKHLDFVVCEPSDSTILLAIELDDQSHEKQSRQERDGFVDDAMKVAGVPLHRFTAKRTYSVQDIRAVLQGEQVAAAEAVPPAVPDGAPDCPSCGTKMVRRTAKTGANAGKEFWGCPSYPRCKGVVAI